MNCFEHLERIRYRKNIRQMAQKSGSSAYFLADSDDWVTIKGTHVMVDESGTAKGGGKLNGMSFKNAKSQKRQPKSPVPSDKVLEKSAAKASTTKAQPAPKMTGADKDALNQYFNTVDGFLVNQLIRLGKVGDQEKFESYLPKITAAIGKGRLKENTQVLRGASFDTASQSTGLSKEEILKNPEKLVGKTLTEKGFMSTTTDQHEADVYGSGQSGGMIYHMTLPKGSHAVDIHEIEDDDDETNEIVVQRGANLKVTKAEKKGNMVHIWCDYSAGPIK